MERNRSTSEIAKRNNDLGTNSHIDDLGQQFMNSLPSQPNSIQHAAKAIAV